MKRWTLGLYVLLAPYLLGIVLLIVIPAGIAVLLSLTSYDALSAPVWVGLDNFTFIATYRAFLYGARNTLGFIALAVPLRILAMLALALLFRQPRRAVKFLRVAVYLPTIIPDVAYALLWTWIFNPLWGPANLILQLFGLPTPAWIVDRSTVGWILIVMSLFQIGEGFVVILAGLHDIPRDYYQSAEIDGATRWQLFRFVTLPFLRPWLVLLTFRDIAVGAQNIFTPAFLMMGGSRAYAAWFLPQMLYEEAFGRFRFGVASAVMVTWLAAAGLLLFLAFRLLRGWGYVNRSRRRWPIYETARAMASLLVALIFSAPLIWLVLGSLQPPGQTSPPLPLLPTPMSLSNYGQIFQVYKLGRPLLNSLLVVAPAVPLTVITASGAGFALTHLPDRLRRHLLVLTVILMIVPIPALWLPRFVMFSAMGWIDTFLPLIIPAVMGSNPFFVLLFYWTFRHLPHDLVDAARLDGAGSLKVWWLIGLPLARATTAVVAVLTFALYWSDYMSALIYLRSEGLYTLSLRLQLFMTQDIPNQPLAMAATVLTILPILLLFLWIQRYLWPEGRT